MSTLAAPLQTIDVTDAEFARFQSLMQSIAGISLPPSKKMLLTGRLAKRLKANGLNSYSEYLRLITGGSAPDELQQMVELLTTNETYFFREDKHFEFVETLLQGPRPAGQCFDVWSAASSTGEEPYSLAMVLAARLGLQGPWSVLGSDINTRVLAAAREGLYSLDRTRDMPAAYLHSYCLKGVRSQSGKVLIDPALRARVQFRPINLNETLPAIGPFDLIFLRNVMIYFDLDTKRQVVGRLIGKLRPGGHLIVGHSETLHGIDTPLVTVRPTIYRLP